MAYGNEKTNARGPIRFENTTLISDINPFETGCAETKLGSQKSFSGTNCILNHKRFKIDLPDFV